MNFEIKAKFVNMFKWIGYDWVNENTYQLSQALCNCWANFTSFSNFVFGVIWI